MPTPNADGQQYRKPFEQRVTPPARIRSALRRRPIKTLGRREQGSPEIHRYYTNLVLFYTVLSTRRAPVLSQQLVIYD